LHEWLWAYADDAETVRRINRFLHSQHASALSGTELFRILSRLGLVLPKVSSRSNLARPKHFL
jgi:hypothetical protein